MTTPAAADRPPLRILHVAGNLTLSGGAQRQLLEVIRRLPPERYAHTVVDLLGDGGLRPAFLELRVPVFDHTSRPLDPYGFRRTAALARNGRFDLVHAHLSRGEIVGWIATWRLPRSVPFVLHKYNVDAWWRRFPLSWIHRRATARAAAIVTPSERVADFYRDPGLHVADPSRLVTIPFGRVSDEPPPREQARPRILGELSLPAETPLLVAAGRLVEQKRHDLLLDAFARVRAEHPAAHLAIAGSGELEPVLRERAARPDLAGHVHFIGLRSDLMDWLAGTDLFVNSSDWEGLPLVVLDAMAAAAPIVATAVAAVPDCIVDRESGRLVPPGDVDALTTALTDALAHPERARQWGDAAERRVAERFSIDRAARQWGELYDRLCPWEPSSYRPQT